jgi:hypothetical protein
MGAGVSGMARIIGKKVFLRVLEGLSLEKSGELSNDLSVIITPHAKKNT